MLTPDRIPAALAIGFPTLATTMPVLETLMPAVAIACRAPAGLLAAIGALSPPLLLQAASLAMTPTRKTDGPTPSRPTAEIIRGPWPGSDEGDRP